MEVLTVILAFCVLVSILLVLQEVYSIAESKNLNPWKWVFMTLFAPFFLPAILLIAKGPSASSTSGQGDASVSVSDGPDSMVQDNHDGASTILLDFAKGPLLILTLIIGGLWLLSKLS